MTIDGGFCGIGYATTYADAAKFAARYVKIAEKYVSSLVNSIDK